MRLPTHLYVICIPRIRNPTQAQESG
jgi:hypothetical protein